MTSRSERVAGGGRGPQEPARRRAVFVASESALVVALLLVWLLSEDVRASRSLWVLFFYSFPSEFLVGLVPHEPVLIFFGTYHAAWIVALVSVASTVMAEAMNYSFFSYLFDQTAVRGISRNPAVRKTAQWFARAPFAAILFAGFGPLPFFPVRFLVVMTSYPVWKYLLGVFLSRAPRFFILAAFGAFLDIPAGWLMALFLVLLLSVNVPALVHLVLRSGTR